MPLIHSPPFLTAEPEKLDPQQPLPVIWPVSGPNIPACCQTWLPAADTSAAPPYTAIGSCQQQKDSEGDPSSFKLTVWHSDGHLWWCWNIAWLITGSRCHKVTVPEPAYSDGHGRNPWRGADLHWPSRIFCPTALSQWRRTVSGVYKQPAVCFCFWIQYCSWTSVFVMLWCSGSKTSSRCSAALWGIYGTDKHLLGIQSTQKRLIWNSETLARVPPQQAARTLLQKFPVAHVLMDYVRTVRPQMAV